MNAKQRRKGMRAQERLLSAQGFTAHSYLDYWQDRGKYDARCLSSAADRRLVKELTLMYPRAEVIRAAVKRHPEPKEA